MTASSSLAPRARPSVSYSQTTNCAALSVAGRRRRSNRPPARRRRKLAAAIARTVTRPWTIMEVCGGQTHTIVKYGIDRILPREVELVHGPGCPVCVTSLEMIDRAHAIASRPGRDLLLVRRHAARARLARRPAAAQVAGERRARRLFAARRREPGGGEPRSPGRVLRHRLRDHGAAQRDGRLAGPQAEADELQRAGLARAGAAGDRRPSCEAPDNRVQGFLGPGHVCTVMGSSRVRADRPPLPRADRDHRLRAARPARRRPAHGAAARSGPGGGREPVRAAPCGPRATRSRGD